MRRIVQNTVLERVTTYGGEIVRGIIIFLSVFLAIILSVHCDHAQAEQIMENVIVPGSDAPKVQARIDQCSVPENARGFWGGGDIGKNWSVGNIVAAQMVRYNLTKGSASLNSQGLGGGLTFRYYPSDWMAEVDHNRDIRRIKPECRATTFSAKTLADSLTEGKLAFPFLSISATAFVAKLENTEQISIQPTLLFGIYRDLVNIGIGFNATGPDKGNTFLMLGFGTGFNF